jgi:uncharacterized protein YdaU (DUF1376 family)
MSNRDLPMMPWWPQDFLAATAHWSSAERGAYAVLLMYGWVLDGLPPDHAELARLCNETPQGFDALWLRIGSKFFDEAGVLRNKRLEEHRAKAIKMRDSRAQGADMANAVRRAKRDAQRALSDALDQRSAQRPNDAGRNAQTTHPYPYQDLREEGKKNGPTLSVTLSERVLIPEVRTTPHESAANESWRDVEGLNGDAFEAYLAHIDVLVSTGQVRTQLAPHSRIAQGKWLAGQGGWSRQQDIVTRAIRNGWKTLERAETRGGRRSFDDLHKE